jgi:hypothetical protein
VRSVGCPWRKGSEIATASCQRPRRDAPALTSAAAATTLAQSQGDGIGPASTVATPRREAPSAASCRAHGVVLACQATPEHSSFPAAQAPLERPARLGCLDLSETLAWLPESCSRS